MMDFDSPEAEQEFPGLYAESKAGDEEGRKILSVKKKKDKDKGYKAFEEDGSGASCEDVNKASASASASRRFKFGKSSSKTSSSKPAKVKLFGVDLADVLRKNPSTDPRTPLVPRFLTDLLNYLETEHRPGVNFYKGTSHFKSKIHQARHALNYGQELSVPEPQIAAGVVKLFLREQPSHILGPAMESKLEETKPSEKKTQKIQHLYQKETADVNKAVFERLVLHMEIIGIDLTPLLRVSQKALVVLKPVMSPLSIEDELKVEEARLARMHLLVAKAKESKDKHKSKENNQEKLWEAQRNVTQLKRKLKQISSTNTTEIKEVEMNFEERRDDSDTVHNADSQRPSAAAAVIDAAPVAAAPVATAASADDGVRPSRHAGQTNEANDNGSGSSREPPLPISDGPPREPEAQARGREAEHGVPPEQAVTDLAEQNKQYESGVTTSDQRGQTTGGAAADATTLKPADKQAPGLEAPPAGGVQSKISPAPEPKHHQILQPVPAPIVDAEPNLNVSKPPDVDMRTFEDEVFASETRNAFTGDVATPVINANHVVTNTANSAVDNAAIAKPEALSGKPLDAAELRRVQHEWQNVIIEQVELLRVKDDVRRRIRDEHKQIKMIRMVRNHKSRLASMKPTYQDPLEKMSTDKLREVLQRLIESNAKLTKDSHALAEKVFEERMSLIQLRTSQRRPFVS